MITNLHRPVCTLLGCRYPVVLAGMGGVARSELVAAVTEAGGFGFLGMVRETPEMIGQEVGELRRLGYDRFGVNLIPAATPPALLEAELDACIALGVPVICLFWDIDPKLVQRLRAAGIVVVYQVGSAPEARAAEAAGAHLIIAQGVEAGGHVRGTVPLHELVPQTVASVSVPVLAAGGIVDAEDMVVALGLGAQGVVLGTAMIATPEAFAHDAHKERLLAASGSDTVLTKAFHVNWPVGATVRVLASKITAGRRGDPETHEREIIGWEGGRPIYLFSTDSPLRSMSGDFGAMPLYAGMGVGHVTKMMGAGPRLERLVAGVDALLQLPGADKEPAASSPVCYAGVNPDYMGYLGHDALIGRLEELRQLACGALIGSHANPAAKLIYGRWVVALGLVIEELDGRPNAPRRQSDQTLHPTPDLVADVRALLPLVFEDRVRNVLSALIWQPADARASQASPSGLKQQETRRACGQ